MTYTTLTAVNERTFTVFQILDNSRTHIIGYKVARYSDVGGLRAASASKMCRPFLVGEAPHAGAVTAQAEMQTIADKLNAEAAANRARIT